MSRTLLVVVLLAVVAGVVFLLVGNPFALKGDAVDGSGKDADGPGALSPTSADAAMSGDVLDGGALASGADTVGKGDVRLRLLSFRSQKPIVGQAVTLTLRAGEAFEKKSDEQGRVVFTDLRASKAWTMTIEGPGFSPVEVKGVAVKVKETNDLGDYLLGDRVVLRGRVIDERGKPIVGASVSAYTGGGLDVSQGIIVAIATSALDRPLPSDETQTDDAGMFTLGQLSPGKPYEVQAKRAGHALYVQSSLVLSPDRTMGLLTIVLGLGATVKGKVTDENGKPVANATVIAMEDMGFGGRMQSLKRDYAQTKPDGTYVLDTLSRGARYRFGVAATGYAPMFESAQSTPLTVEVEASRDFQLKKGGSIEGKVTDKGTGQPVADARVIAVVGVNLSMGMMGGRGRGGPGGRGPGGPTGGAPQPEEPQHASTQIVRTASDGTFRIDGLIPGPVAIAQVKKPGYADYSATTFPSMGMPGMPAAPVTPAWGDVKAGETLAVSVQLEPGGSVTGRVTAAGAGSTQAVGGAQVSVIAMSFTAMFTGFGTAVTGDDGSFRVEGVRPGKYIVTATAAGYIAPDGMKPESQVDMPEAGGSVQKDIVMSAAGSVEGVVTDTKGRPVGAARVRTRPAPQRGSRGGFGFSPGMIRQALSGGGSVVLTDVDGRYRIDSVGVDEKTIVVAESDEMVPSESEPFDARAGETRTVNLVLSGGGTLRGRVIDDHGAVVAGAKLRIGHLDADTDASPTLNAWMTDRLLDQRTFFSDNDGGYEINRIQPGRTLLKAEKEGYTTSYRRDLNMQPDDVRDNHNVTLVKGQSISGVVKGDDGKPVVGALIAVTKQASPQRFGGGAQPADPAEANDGTVEPQMNDRTDAEGKFTVDGIPPGPSYSVVVWGASGYRGYGQGDEAAIKRGIPSNARDVEFVLKKMAEGESPFGSTGAARTGPPIPRPPGVPPGMGGGGTMPIPGR